MDDQRHWGWLAHISDQHIGRWHWREFRRRSHEGQRVAPMSEYFVVFNADDLAVRWTGVCQDGMAERQNAVPGTAARLILACHGPDELEAIREDGRIVVRVKDSGERVDIE